MEIDTSTADRIDELEGAPPANGTVDGPLVDEPLVEEPLVEEPLVEELLVEEISIDGMCGVY